MANDQKFPTQASGGGPDKGKPDGVSASPAAARGVDVQGRTSGGDGEGGAYPNPHTGREPTQGGLMGHGGQTEIGYHGGGQAGEEGKPTANATTRSADNERGNH
ncbi:hypothetical protein V5740_10025 [Croceibacterium sp. TMG7-5b_MA50]|uniref:hypothetical protein n=1 Tax=Croceibacterium sp. TMG7-5b_MA50 TaxID=3121290 RepID=UPI003221F7E4